MNRRKVMTYTINEKGAYKYCIHTEVFREDDEDLCLKQYLPLGSPGLFARITASFGYLEAQSAFV